MNIGLPLLLMKNWRYVLLALFLLLMTPLILIGGIFGQYQIESTTDDIMGGGGGEANVSPEVLRYKPLLEKYAEMYGVEQYVSLLLAKMQQESGGRLPDVMQSSESIGLPPNTITDPEYSIEVGVRYFAKVLKNADGDIKLTLQSYNFGDGFIPFAESRGGYSKEVAVQFSNMMANKLGWRRYGDINYVENVMRYYKPAENPSVVAMGMGSKTYQSVMKIALQYQGKPYEWGGEHPSTSFDCSGLWFWSFRQIGINIPRTAEEQYKFTQRISKEQLKPGDFIFFTGTADHSYVSHVGLYTGDGMMYNSNSDGVNYSPLKGYWQSHILGYGRLKEINL
ncbi:bifunctional lytic transglycosylase/C40 family peptidase [Bacillus sp. JJ634]